jgi:hypothetical protein
MPRRCAPSPTFRNPFSAHLEILEISGFRAARGDDALGRVRKGAYSAMHRVGIPTMSAHIALFRFRLHGGHSIGAIELRRLWASACRSDNVSVSRVAAPGNGGAGYMYSLCGPPRMPDGPEIEKRLRQSLVTALPKATIALIRL